MSPRDQKNPKSDEYIVDLRDQGMECSDNEDENTDNDVARTNEKHLMSATLQNPKKEPKINFYNNKSFNVKP